MIEKTLKFDDETLELLDRVNVLQVGREWHGSISGQLDRNEYVKLNKALEALGGKWNRGKKAHVFQEEPAINELKENGEMVQEKYGWFATPKPVADKMAQIILDNFHGEINSKSRMVLEPSAGEGALIDAILPYLLDPKLCLVELHPGRADYLRAKYRKNYPGATIITSDWVKVGRGEKFDIIIMNPPFENKQDANHVLKAAEYLADGGILVSVMGAGVKFREDKEYQMVRELSANIIDLPEGAFKESGTMVNACIVVIEK